VRSWSGERELEVDLIVVGAGIGGSSVTRIARAHGHQVTLVSEGPPHSLAATAVLHRRYHVGKPGELGLWGTSMALYDSWGVTKVQGGLVTNYRTPGRDPRADNEWAMIDPAAPLVPPDASGHVRDATGCTVTLEDGSVLEAQSVVIASGATGNLSRAGRRSWGVTWVHDDIGVLHERSHVRVHHVAPYKKITATVLGGAARLGSSNASTPEKALTSGEKLLQQAYEAGMVSTVQGWRAVLGARLAAQPYTFRTPSGAWGLGGFHRTGYALGPGAALDLCRLIGAV
jgi:hypothetical protein